MFCLRPHRRLAPLGQCRLTLRLQPPTLPGLHHHLPFHQSVPILRPLLHSLVPGIPPHLRLSAVQQLGRPWRVKRGDCPLLSSPSLAVEPGPGPVREGRPGVPGESRKASPPFPGRASLRFRRVAPFRWLDETSGIRSVGWSGWAVSLHGHASRRGVRICGR